MICTHCGADTEGRDHNGRGLRCTHCWAQLPHAEVVTGYVSSDTDDLGALGLSESQLAEAAGLGLATFRDVRDAPDATLTAITGVGRATARKLRAAAEEMVA